MALTNPMKPPQWENVKLWLDKAECVRYSTLWTNFSDNFISVYFKYRSVTNLICMTLWASISQAYRT